MGSAQQEAGGQRAPQRPSAGERSIVQHTRTNLPTAASMISTERFEVTASTRCDVMAELTQATSFTCTARCEVASALAEAESTH